MLRLNARLADRLRSKLFAVLVGIQWVLAGLAVAPGQAGAAEHTTGGVPLPAGWGLIVADRFGTGAGSTVSTLTQLHAKYYEGQFYNRDAAGLVRLPNVVINGEQQTYVHFEKAVVFAGDHLTIQGRGHPDGTITSAEMVSKHTARSFCIEAKYQIPAADKSWPAFWMYGCATGSDRSEFDVEQPVTPHQGVHHVSLHNHPSQSNVVISDSHFTTPYMTWKNTDFDASTAPHVYTVCYDDTAKTVKRFIDGKLIYTCTFDWNASLGGTGHGPDACTIVNLAVGGAWPGNLTDPSSYHGDLDVYSIEYYGPVAAVNQMPVIDSPAWATPAVVSGPATTVLSVTARDPDSAPAPLKYTWSKVSGPGSVVFSPNATAAAATTTATFGLSGSYALLVTVSDGAATVTGTVGVTVTLPPIAVAPSLTVQPVNLTTTAGQTATFQVTATGTGPLSYQWRKGSTAVGSNAATLTLLNVQAVDAGSYSVTVSNSAGAAISHSATLTVNPVSTGGGGGSAAPGSAAVEKRGGCMFSAGSTGDRSAWAGMLALGLMLVGITLTQRWARARSRCAWGS